jgi:CheY-like chemotaxis protein
VITPSDILHASILIVDDQAPNVLLLDRMLRGAGYVSIESTSDPTQVCDLHRKHRYDLIILDLQMPEMDGFQVMEGLKEIERGGYLPVLVITAEPDHKLRALQAGANDFVCKPFDLAEVLMRVRNMLQVRLLYLGTTSIQKMVGVSKDETALSHVGFAVRQRLPWLEVNLLTAFLAASVVGIFEGTITRYTALAVLLPIVAGQSGNTGMQALAVTMRGLLLREVGLKDWSRLVAKEARLGIFNGLAVAAVTMVGVFVWSRSLGLIAVIGAAMVISMVIAGIAGTAVPLLLKRLGHDPAQSSSIVLTTITDCVGFFTFLGLATAFSALLA